MTETTSDRELDAILKLVELTQSGKLRWTSKEPWGDLKDDHSTRIASVFLTRHGDTQIRLYIKRKRIDGPSPFHALTSILNSNQSFPYWTEQPILEITNSHGSTLWTFPQKSALTDLEKAVRRQASGANDLIEALLSSNKI